MHSDTFQGDGEVRGQHLGKLKERNSLYFVCNFSLSLKLLQKKVKMLLFKIIKLNEAV